MKALFKKKIFKLFNILSFLIPVRSELKLQGHTKIVVLMQKPLGIGDLVMLSPLVLLLEKKFPQYDVCIVTEYEKFLNFERAVWLLPQSLNKSFLSSSMLISPMPIFSHAKYIFQPRYFIGYFFSNRLICNFIRSRHKYSFTEGHYFQKIFPILDALNVEYDKESLIYPDTLKKKTDTNGYDVVIAPYSNWCERQYPMSRFIDLICLLTKDMKCRIILVGSANPAEVEFNNKLESLIDSRKLANYTGKTSLLQMNSLISTAKLYIGNDSGPSHIAYISARKSLVFFGSVRFEDRVPLNLELRKKITCADSRDDCIFFPCYNGLSKPNCINERKYVCISDTFLEDQLIVRLLN